MPSVLFWSFLFFPSLYIELDSVCTAILNLNKKGIKLNKGYLIQFLFVFVDERR